MKNVVILIMALLASGCATSVPKEELRDIFILVGEKKFAEAEKKLNEAASGSLIGQFSTYSGEAIPAYQSPYHDDVCSLISGAKSSIEDCQEKIDKLQKLSPYNPISDEETNFIDEFENSQSDFNNRCKRSSQGYRSPITQIKKYSSVDLFSIFEEMEINFNKQVERINSELTRIESEAAQKRADERSKQELFESSPEYYSKKLCEFDDRVKLGNKIIQRENEAGKISGYVDKTKLYEAGKVIQINKDLIKRFSEEYKLKFNKLWQSGDCK